MKASAVNVTRSVGRILYSTIVRDDGKKILLKGHRIEREDAQMLQAEGMNEVVVAELEDGEIDEDEAVMQVASEMGCGSLEIKLAVGGRANLFTTQPCCVLVDSELLKQTNSADSLVVATSRSFSFAASGQRVAAVKSHPFAVARRALESILSLLAERGPILQARPIVRPEVAVLYADPVDGDRASQLFGTIMSHRLDRLGTRATPVRAVMEAEEVVVRALEELLRAKPTVIIVASTMAPAGPYDIVGRALVRAGCQIEHFLAPVEPGNLLLLGYKDNVAVLSAPGCYRSARRNVLDLVLPPLLARYHLSSGEIASLGHGGLLA